MTPPLPPNLATLLEKAAFDNGFDREFEPIGEWLHYGSTQIPLHVWLGAFGNVPLAAFSQEHVARALGDTGTPLLSPLPPGAAAGRSVADLPQLHRLLRRAFQLGCALPDQPLRQFEQRTASLPRTTEAERQVIQRVGQELFRAGLLEYWEGRCAVTGLAVPELLRASHIKPWADCATDAERLDIYNGLLLAPHLDAAFDRGLVTFDAAGVLVVADTLDTAARVLLGLDRPLRLRTITDPHRAHLVWHREKVFRG